MDKHGAEIGALITDVNLGGPMDGWKLTQYAQERLFEQPVIYTTSYGVEWAAFGVKPTIRERMRSFPVGLEAPSSDNIRTLS